jgi:hypothetical protein
MSLERLGLGRKITLRWTSVSIATGYGLDDRMVGIRFPEGTGNFFFDIKSRMALGLNMLPRVPGNFIWGVKRPGC